MSCLRFLLRMTLSTGVICSLLSVSLPASETDDALRSIRAVSHQAKGNQAAQAAYQELIKQDRSVLPAILQAFDGANPLAENYLRSAFEVIASGGQGEVPVGKLEAYLADLENNQKARAMVFEYLAKSSPDKMSAKLDGMLNDPSAEIRFKAVQKVLDRAQELDKAGKQEEATLAYRRALDGATEEGQVKTISEALKKAGVNVDLQKHFGLLTEWKIIGPFDNKDMKAFDIAYPPEKELDFSATYDGMEGQVSWQVIASDADMGNVDIAKSIGPYKGAVMYMYTEYNSPEEQEVFVRMATANAWKLWVNDELIFAREEYHRGMRWDQYRIPVSLKKGTNRLLFKILQNEMTQDWAQQYQVQFRVCDKSGKGLLPVTEYDPKQ